MKNFFKFTNGAPLFPTNTTKKTHLLMVLSIIAFCLATAAAQGSKFFYCSHYTKLLVLACVFCGCIGVLVFFNATRRMDENHIVFLMILTGTFLRCGYVLLSGLYERQHDAGAFTGMGTDFVNPGHIGYIEYIYKFHRLPDLNPYQLFAYYHPPLHHILSYLWLQLNIWLGVTEELAFENLQILPLFYSCLCMVVTWKILKVLQIRGSGLYIGLGFVVFHPATIIMAGSVNNDMLTILFMCLIIYESLKWIRNKNLPGLIRLALYIGFGMVTKLNSAVLAIPLGTIFLMHFISVLRSGDRMAVLKWVRNYCIFAAVAAPIGLSWVARNLVRFGEKPGVPVPGETSPMYTAPYSLWSRLGIPALTDWNFPFPFHPVSAKACNNTWAIMFHTSLFAEEYPAGMPDILLVLCQVTFALAVVFGIAAAVLFVAVLLNKKTEREDRVFLLTGYAVTLVSFAAFVLIYPYTCSSDFRYVAICLIYMAIGIGLGNKHYFSQLMMHETNWLDRIRAAGMHIINGGIVTILVFVNLIYVFWGRW
ncbi:hypothetical protein IMSAGC019_02694 [Lachnospiraceae bacterium]|nr:hypothetical protein IMSAGC019_02694 [Lachnospiraceae bacterium]